MYKYFHYLYFTELREQVHVTSNQNNIIPFVTTYNPRDYNRSQIKRKVYFNMFRVTGSEIKIHMGVSIFRENVHYYVVIC
jgi:uracil-DNA glycosylase